MKANTTVSVCFVALLLLTVLTSCHSVPQSVGAFPENVFGTKEIYAIVSSSRIPDFYKLKNISWSQWFTIEKGILTKVKEYPIEWGPSKVSADSLSSLRELLVAAKSYDNSGEKIYCGYPEWDYMLTYSNYRKWEGNSRRPDSRREGFEKCH
jgi:hypothetical protein